MARIIAYKNKQGKLNITFVGNDVKQNILAATNQGFERKAGVEKNRVALLKVLQETPTEYMDYTEYQAFLRARKKVGVKVRKLK